jgi:hypothetical protein
VAVRPTIALLTLVIAQPASAQLPGQSFQVTPETANATVGDTVAIRFRVTLHQRDLLLDTVPQPMDALPPGVRVLSVDQLTRAADRVFHGRARVAFYRPGRRPVPVFALPFMRIVEGIPRATLSSDTAFVEISAVLPAGDPPLKDIKELEPSPGPRLAPLIMGLVLAVAAALYRLRRQRRRPPSMPLQPEPPAQPVVRHPYEIALERLHRVEQKDWPSRGQVARHYEAVVDVLRVYLEDAEGVGARERTSSELLWALPPHLTAGGLRARCHEVLADADLVKFAEVRPSEASAADFLTRSRRLLETWHQAQPLEESADALR